MYEQNRPEQVPGNHIQMPPPVYLSDQYNRLWPAGIHEDPDNPGQLVIQGTPDDPYSEYVDPRTITWHDSALAVMGIQQPVPRQQQRLPMPGSRRYEPVRQQNLSWFTAAGKYVISFKLNAMMSKLSATAALLAVPVEASADVVAAPLDPVIVPAEAVGNIAVFLYILSAINKIRKRE